MSAPDENVPEAIDEALAAGGEPSGEELLAAAREETAQLKDRWLRAEAEAENVRKRAQREFDEQRKYAELPLLRELLPVADNMARTVEAAAKAQTDPAVLEGFRLVAKQLEDAFARRHCQRIEALHQPFDPHRHEALLQQPSAEHPPGTVLAVLQQGYLLFDRVVRPAQVIVSKAAEGG